MPDKQFCTLGSGDLYIKEFPAGSVIPEDHSLIEIPENLIGEIAAGAEVGFKPEFKDIRGSMNRVIHRFIINSEVTFKTGIMTWNNDILHMLAPGSTIDKTAARTIIKIGGRGALKSYLIRFVHTILDTGLKYRVTLVGTATNGFELIFDKEDETVIDAEFTALACDSEGNQLWLEEEHEVPVKADLVVGEKTIIGEKIILTGKK